MKAIYLDHNATTPMSVAARTAWTQGTEVAWANASSAHGPGAIARRLLEESRASLASLLGVQPSQVIFTSGGTEANVMALHHMAGEARARGARKPRFLMVETEHPSVGTTLAHWAALGDIEMEILPVESSGLVNLEALDRALPGSAGLCAMWANNETGVLHPLSAIGDLAREHGVPWHCDGVQAVGRLPADGSPGFHTLSVSAHKLAGPKGVGALLAPGWSHVSALFPGESPEHGARAGTSDVAGAAAFAAAAQESAVAARGSAWGGVEGIRDALEAFLVDAFPQSVIHGAGVPRLPNTCSIALRNDGAWVDGDDLVAELDAGGVAVSTGAACSTGTSEPSHVLTAMGASPEQCLATLRVSLGLDSTREDVLVAGRKIVGLARRLSA